MLDEPRYSGAMADRSLAAQDVALVGLLVDRCPSLLPVLQQHVDDFGLLPHVFFGDVTRWVVGRYITQPSDPELEAALELLEQEFARAEELICASFLGNLPGKTDAGAGIRDCLGEELTKHLRLVAE
jgi:hypothetical protein